ncbi:MAG: relaxase domain-containing protein [Acidobacteriaceae bacterium]|nr:relaxase domain-containing protein [Acidobacteriaceae bacterium]
MVDPSKPLTPAKVKEYYKTEYSAASNSYFSQAGSLQGHWHGQLASEFGLTGTVDAEAFDRLAEGQHPGSGVQLIAHRDTHLTRDGKEVPHRAGWDLTFNAPKTVSLTALVGNDERVREAHREAVERTLDYLERYTQARIGGNAPPATTGKWITATFEHDTARPVDGYPAPHLHTHAIIFNMTADAEGQHRSLQPYEFFRAQAMATAIYQAELGNNLRKLGYEVTRGTNDAPDIAGYSAEYLTAESLRNAQLKQRLEELGLTGRRAEDIINHQNREEKLKITPGELRALHRGHAEAFGNQPDVVVGAAANKVGETVSAEERARVTSEAVSSATRKLTERNAVIEEHRVIEQALKYAHGRVLVGDVEEELASQRSERKLIAVTHVRPHAPGHRYTTPAMIHMEREVITRVLSRRDKLAPVVENADLSRFQILRNNERRQAVVRGLLSTNDQIVAVQGGAGTGKTTVLGIIREIAEQQGYQVRGLTPTSRARNALNESGVESETLQRHLLRSAADRDGSKRRLYFVDESSLTSTAQMYKFLSGLGNADRVILVGDMRQHQSVEAGRIFEELQKAGMKTAQLNKVVRQKDESLKRAVILMANGKISEGVEALHRQGRVHEVTHRAERFTAIARAYADSPENTLVVSPDNKSRGEINSAIRDELKRDGQLTGEQLFQVLVRKDVHSEDRRYARSYRPGDAIRFHTNLPTLKIKSGQVGTIVEVNPEQNILSVKVENGLAPRFLAFNPASRSNLSVFESRDRAFAIGDRIQFTTPWREKGIASRETGRIEHIEKNGNIAVRLETGRRVAWNLNEYNYLDHAYAMTSHSSQGVTVDRVLIHVDTTDSRVRGLVDKTLSYVATSRARYDAQVFTDNASQLSRALARENVKETALSEAQIRKYRSEYAIA